jgi:hypothetical protein
MNVRKILALASSWLAVAVPFLAALSEPAAAATDSCAGSGVRACRPYLEKQADLRELVRELSVRQRTEVRQMPPPEPLPPFGGHAAYWPAPDRANWDFRQRGFSAATL